MIPFARNTYFTGRQDELKELEEMISTPNGPRKLAVTGLGGIGKSQIALEIAHRLSKIDAKRLVFWIPCTSFETIEQGFVDIVQTLDLRKADPAEAKETVQVHLSKHLTKWLLILDNVDDESIWVFLEKFLPQSDEGRTLVTTRTWQVAAKVAGTGGSGALKKIEQPSEETAIEMLKTRLLDKELVNETEAATALLRRLTCLPLAITQAAAYINQTGPNVTLLDYLRLLDNQEREVVELLSTDFKDETRYVDARNPVASTWLVSFEQIRKSNFSAAEYLSLMACVDSYRIPREFFPSLASDKDKLEALGLLSGFSFITMEPCEGPITLHRLVHLAIRNWLRKELTITGYRQQAVELMEKTMCEAHMENQPLVRPSLPHAMVLLNETQDDLQIKLGDLLHLTGVSLYHEGRYQEARIALQKLLLIIEEEGFRVSGDDDPAFMLTLKAMIVETYIGQAQLDKAEELGLYVLEQRKQLLGVEHADTLGSMNQLSGLYKMQERWNEAMPLYLQLLDIHKRRRSRGDETTLGCLNDLVETFRALGNWKEAEQTQLQALETVQDTLGPYNEDYLMMMNSLVTTYLKQGRYMEGRLLAKKVVDGASKDSKLGHLLVASLVALAACYTGQEEWKEAEELAVQAIAKSEEVLGRDHLLNLTAIDLLVRIYLRQKKWKAAEDVGAPATDTAKKLYGPRHSITLGLMAGLALAYRHQERWSEAEEIELQVFDAQMDMMGLGHSKTLASMDKLREIYTAQGREEEAKRLKERALTIEVKARGRGLEDPQVLENMHKLALTWHGLGRVEDARELMARTIRLRKEVCGLDHDATEASARVLASWEKAILPERSRLRERLKPRAWLGKFSNFSRSAIP
jgi:tetratricopeptide (TPR) repeat protein